MERLAKVKVPFDLMRLGEVFIVDPDDERINALLGAGYLVLEEEPVPVEDVAPETTERGVHGKGKAR